MKKKTNDIITNDIQAQSNPPCGINHISSSNVTIPKESVNTPPYNNTISNEDITQTSQTSTMSGEDKSNKQIKRPNNYQFESNGRYFTICIYALFVITFGTLIIYSIVNFTQTKATIHGFFNALFPFIVAFFIAYMLNPIVNRFYQLFHNKFKMKSQGRCKALSILLSYLLVIGILTITLLYILPQLGTSIVDLTNKLPGMLDEVAKYLQNLEDKFPTLDFKFIETQINDALPQIVSFGTNLVKDLVPLLLNLSVSIVKIVINILLAVVISVYMLNDKKNISKNLCKVLYAFISKRKADNFRQTANECNLIFSNFIIGKSIDSLIIGIICFVVMSILRLPYSLLLSVVVGITNMIPYFGPFIGAVPGILLYLIISPIKAVIFGIMILALQQFDGLYLGPKILGSSTGLKPLWVIFAITIGGAYGGVLGMFLGVPIVGVISHLCNKLLTHRLNQKNIDADF